LNRVTFEHNLAILVETTEAHAEPDPWDDDDAGSPAARVN
jgi:hypothetical protein